MKKLLFSLIATIALINLSAVCRAEETAPVQPAALTQETPAQAQAPEVARPKCLAGIEFLSGYSWGKLRVAARNYNSVPFLVDLDFDLKPLLKKINVEPALTVQFIVEPYAAFITSPKSNAEVGTSFLLKAGLVPETWKIQPYFKGGAGMTYISLHTHEQGSQFNFIEYGGIGVSFFLRKNTALTLEGRFRHLSNAGIASPNTGINTYFVVAGITEKF